MGGWKPSFRGIEREREREREREESSVKEEETRSGLS